MTRKLAKAGGSYLAGMLAASFLSVILSLSLGAAAVTAGICLGAFFRPKKGGGKYTAAVCSVCCGLGMLAFACYGLFAVRPLEKLDGCEFSGSGKICLARHYDNASLYAAEFDLPGGRKGKAAFYLYNEERLVKGDSVTVAGTLCMPDSSGFFDSKNWFSSQGIFLTLQDASLQDFRITDNNIFRTADSFRLKTAAHFRFLLNGSSRGELLIGMLFGQNFCRLGEKSRDMLSMAGISHIAAVSGLHMSIAAGIAAAAASALKLPKWAKFAAAGISAAVFGLCADLTMSVMRSLIMILLVHSAELFRRRSDPLTSLTAAFLVITAGCPYVIRNTSLLLSGSGVLGTAIAAPLLTAHWEELVNSRTKRHTPYKTGIVLSAAFTCICAYCAVFPVSCLTFDKVSPAAPLVNLLLSPFFTAAVTLAAVGAFFGMFPLLAPLGNGAVYAGSLMSGIILKGAETAGSQEAAVIPTGLEIMPLLVIVTILSGAAGFAFTSRKSFGLLTFSAAVFICSVCLAVMRAIPPKTAEIAVITEGNGCAVVVCGDKETHVIDCSGSSSCAAAVKKFIDRRGLKSPSEIVAYSEKSAMVYSEKFYDTLILSPYPEDSGRDIAENEYIKGKQSITGGIVEITPMEKAMLINIDGVSVISVNAGDGYIDGDYDIVIINSAAAAEYKAPANYIVTRRKFSGSLPAGSDTVFCECACYKVTEKGAERKRE
ncbi:MAG: ComEC/Rec2 family competence protein, partial [Ruminococcus sp.]|nr:ComEC/Rec2 family competence protein [Ruminococcus sp.]